MFGFKEECYIHEVGFFLPVNLIKTLSIRCSLPRALTFGQIHTTEFILEAHLFHPKLHIPLAKLLLKDVLLVLTLLSAHLKPKGKQISRRLQSPRLGWLNLPLIKHHFFSPPKSQLKKIIFTQYSQAEEYRASLCSIWSSFPKNTQNPDTTTCG